MAYIAVKPWLLRYLLNAGQPVAYFDPDVCFYAPVEGLEEIAREHQIVLTPHMTKPFPDDGELPELRFDCIIDVENNYFVDQRWFDLVPGLFPNTAIMQDPGLNVAYWNLHEHEFRVDAPGRHLVDGVALKFFHFSGFDPGEPDRLSQHQTRFQLRDLPVVAGLCRDYAPEREAKAGAAVLSRCGMHRSGTSLLASLLHRSGWPMGEQMLTADAQNRPGYFEDLKFLDLNRRMLVAAVPVNEPGHPDWGWTEGVERCGVDTRVLEGFVDEADALVAERHSQARKDTAAGGRAAECWGWKDPRTTVLLDFWNARIPDAQYLFIYRPPWDVADSMQRTEAAEFLRHPSVIIPCFNDGVFLLEAIASVESSVSLPCELIVVNDGSTDARRSGSSPVCGRRDIASSTRRIAVWRRRATGASGRPGAATTCRSMRTIGFGRDSWRPPSRSWRAIQLSRHHDGSRRRGRCSCHTADDRSQAHLRRRGQSAGRTPANPRTQPPRVGGGPRSGADDRDGLVEPVILPLASISSTFVNAVARDGLPAVAVLMAADALLPAAGGVVMLVAGALAAGVFAGHDPALFGLNLGTGLGAPTWRWPRRGPSATWPVP